jgi:hypothetical protein
LRAAVEDLFKYNTIRAAARCKNHASPPIVGHANKTYRRPLGCIMTQHETCNIKESMNIFKFNKTYKIDFPEAESIELIRLKYTKLLNLFNFITGSDSNGISFKRKIMDPGIYKRDALNVFQEGNVSINYNLKKLEIIWSVKLDHLYFISFLASICAGVMARIFFNLTFFNLILVGLIGFVLSCIIGISSIITKIAEINITCLEDQ